MRITVAYHALHFHNLTLSSLHQFHFLFLQNGIVAGAARRVESIVRDVCRAEPLLRGQRGQGLDRGPLARLRRHLRYPNGLDARGGALVVQPSDRWAQRYRDARRRWSGSWETSPSATPAQPSLQQHDHTSTIRYKEYECDAT